MPPDDPSLVVVGNFDGVHRGHQAVFHSALELAKHRAVRPVMLTFDPHPSVVLGRTPPPVLTTLARKQQLVARMFPEVMHFVQRFDTSFAALTPEHFAREFLVGVLRSRVVVVGTNFRFGHERRGDFSALEALGDKLGFETRSVVLAADEDGPWSSTRIRHAVAQGKVDEARCILGRPHMLSGVVVRGDQRGRTLGAPTCNLAEVPQVRPAYGVYAVLVDVIEGGVARALARGVANLGVRPTVASPDPTATFEVHLFDVDRDLYGSELQVHFISRIRDEKKFASLSELRAQIERDSSVARERLNDIVPDPFAQGAWS